MDGIRFMFPQVTQHWMETCRSSQTPPGVELSRLNSVRKNLESKQGTARLVSCTHPPPCLISLGREGLATSAKQS